LEYLFEQGDIEESIAKQAARMGQPMPDRIANAPELKQGLQLYLQAFLDLDSERSHAMAPTPIPWTSISTYARHLELDEEQTEALFFIINSVDGNHLARLRKKMKAG